MPTLGRDSQLFVKARRTGRHYLDVYNEAHPPVDAETVDLPEAVETEVAVTDDSGQPVNEDGESLNG